MLDAVAFTHFDTPSSQDNTVVVLVAKENMEKLPSQAIVEIRSLPDAEDGGRARKYLGIIVAGPFAEPDGLRADSSIVVATTVQGKIFLPRYHGRAFVQILGEEVNGQLVPPRFRPRPNSPVFPLSMELEHLLDVVSAFTDWSGITKEGKKKGGRAADKDKDEEEEDVSWDVTLRSGDFAGHVTKVKQRVVTAQAPKVQSSWKSLAGKLWRLQRLQVFDNPRAQPLDFQGLIRPGGVTVIDLSDTDSPQVNNLLLADILRNIQRQQEEKVRKAADEGKRPVPVAVIIEEAHEFLSDQRIRQMPALFQQVARIAKRGRKRWPGSCSSRSYPSTCPTRFSGSSTTTSCTRSAIAAWWIA